MGQAVTLYQTGIVNHLPDPPGQKLFDADRVDASNYAYNKFNSPDGPIMVANYALTAWLAAAGGLDRARRNPLLPIAMGIKLVLDGVTNVELAREEWSENKAFCEYCPRCDGLFDRIHRTRSPAGSYRCWHPTGTPRSGHQSTQQHTLIDTTGKSTDDFLQRCWAYSKC